MPAEFAAEAVKACVLPTSMPTFLAWDRVPETARVTVAGTSFWITRAEVGLLHEVAAAHAISAHASPRTGAYLSLKPCGREKSIGVWKTLSVEAAAFFGNLPDVSVSATSFRHSPPDHKTDKMSWTI